jgi:predicted DNA-binding ribbon-helix-helix protein
MKSLVVKRSIVVAEHKTSVSLEDAFWSGLKEIAARRVTTLSELVRTLALGQRPLALHLLYAADRRGAALS